MGNYKFRLSDMMPNAWFYKLRDMNKTKNPSSQSINKKVHNPRKSSMYQTTEYISPNINPKFFDTHFPHDPPRISSKKRTKRKTIYKPSPIQINPSSVSSDCIDFPTSPDHDFLESPDSFDIPIRSFNEFGTASWSSSSSCKLSSSATDIIMDMEQTSYISTNIEKLSEFDMISEPELPPILTKTINSQKQSPRTFNNSSSTKLHADKRKKSRKSVSRSGGVKIKGSWNNNNNNNKVPNKKNQNRGPENVNGLFYSESFAIVKASLDPEQDFRESMMEMIVENNIRASKDLEELLACYLSLNSNQYHDLIIKAFEQIWFNMPQNHY